jgi:putative membrane protein
LLGFLCLTLSSEAWAHVGEIHSEANSGSQWEFTPDVVTATVLAGIVYAAGVIRRHAFDDIELWRHAAFVAGVAAVFLALESPIDYAAEHAFFMHQVQHFLLHMLAPMLIALSAPQATLTSGLPSILRRKGLAPSVSNLLVKRVFALLANPGVITALYIATLYVWQYPPYHDAALLSEPIHYVMHMTMLAAGILFWWRVFDFRAPPAGLGYGQRLMMLWVVILSNIVLGSYTTFKGEVLYPAYDTVGRIYDMRPLTDEMLGGLIIWIPSSMMCLAGLLIVIHMWGRHETRLDEKGRVSWPANSAALAYPTTGAALVERTHLRNRALAVGFALFAAMVFVVVISIGVLNHLNGATPTGLFASGPAAQEHAIQ